MKFVARAVPQAVVEPVAIALQVALSQQAGVVRDLAIRARQAFLQLVYAPPAPVGPPDTNDSSSGAQTSADRSPKQTRRCSSRVSSPRLSRSPRRRAATPTSSPARSRRGTGHRWPTSAAASPHRVARQVRSNDPAAQDASGTLSSPERCSIPTQRPRRSRRARVNAAGAFSHRVASPRKPRISRREKTQNGKGSTTHSKVINVSRTESPTSESVNLDLADWSRHEISPLDDESPPESGSEETVVHVTTSLASVLSMHQQNQTNSMVDDTLSFSSTDLKLNRQQQIPLTPHGLYMEGGVGRPGFDERVAALHAAERQRWALHEPSVACAIAGALRQVESGDAAPLPWQQNLDTPQHSNGHDHVGTEQPSSVGMFGDGCTGTPDRMVAKATHRPYPVDDSWCIVPQSSPTDADVLAAALRIQATYRGHRDRSEGTE
eukprot:SAG31_NODE_81_length_27131_cov_4.775283_4_plen_435_part_00